MAVLTINNLVEQMKQRTCKTLKSKNQNMKKIFSQQLIDVMIAGILFSGKTTL